MIKSLLEKKNPVILIAEDSDTERLALVRLLKGEGYGVLEARGGFEAMALYEAAAPDAVLLDVLMPDLDGLAVCTHICSRTDQRPVPVFIITAMQDEASVTRAYQAGASDFITKPVNPAVLSQRLKKTLEACDALKELDHRTAFSESVVNHAAEGIVTLDAGGVIRYMNPATLKLFGYPEGALLGQPVEQLLPGFSPAESADCGRGDMPQGPAGEYEGLGADGIQVPLEVTVCRFEVEGHPFYTLTLRDITARKRYEERIRYQAFYDDLTGLPNRAFLKDRIALEIARTRRSHTRFALMYLNRDRVEQINDAYGHEAGDAVLQETARRLKQAVRADDLAARIGGDEFVILLPGLYNADLVGKIAAKILKVVKQPTAVRNHQVVLSISIGITVCPDDGEDYETLLANADIAMNRAKETGKDTFQTFTRELNQRAMERINLENGLQQALERQEFVVHYQPKVSTKNMRIVGMEALLRWQHPTLGLVPPMRFIPVAEETGQIIPLGFWVLKTACLQNQSLVQEGLAPLTVAVNLSMRQFEAANLTESVLKILEETGMPARLLELEITESIAMKDPQHTIAVIRRLQEAGVGFSIDDFGTGYSSLSHISSLAVDKLKIDKSFVSPIDGDEDHGLIAATVLSLGKNLKMKVVAEGVETQTQVDYLRARECDELQGFFIAKPLTWPDFVTLYRENANNQ